MDWARAIGPAGAYAEPEAAVSMRVLTTSIGLVASVAAAPATAPQRPERSEAKCEPSAG